MYFGSSAFAVEPLSAVAKSGHKVLAAVTQPDRPKGRNLALAETPVKAMAEAMGIGLSQPPDVNGKEFIAKARAFGADVFVVIAFGEMFKKELLDIPPKGCVNLHASLLPQYRGAAPINWAIMNGEKKTGVTAMLMGERMDAGDIILSKECDIGEDDTALSLGERLSGLGAEALVEALGRIESGKARYARQDDKAATYAPKLKKRDGLIDWRMGSRGISNRVRGLIPWPAAYTVMNGRSIKIMEIEDARLAETASAKPGEVLTADPKRGIIVRTGDGAVLLRKVQPEGKNMMTSMEYARGHKIGKGTRL